MLTEEIERARAAVQSIDFEEIEALLYDEWKARDERRRAREARQGRPRAVNCFSCGKFKPRPSSICGQCGDDPVGNVTNGDPTAADRLEFDESRYGERVL